MWRCVDVDVELWRCGCEDVLMRRCRDVDVEMWSYGCGDV